MDFANLIGSMLKHDSSLMQKSTAESNMQLMQCRNGLWSILRALSQNAHICFFPVAMLSAAADASGAALSCRSLQRHEQSLAINHCLNPTCMSGFRMNRMHLHLHDVGGPQ